MSVAAGREHGLVATSRGRLLTWGHGGALMGRDGPRELPAPVDVFGPNGGLTARLVAAGEVMQCCLPPFACRPTEGGLA